MTDEAIEDALYICFMFDIVNRLASAFGFGRDTDADRMKLAAMLNRIRYQVPGYFLR